jgi:hypothetical protein
MSDPGVPPATPRLDNNRPDPEDRNAPAPERLMNAVICLLIERGAPLIADALKPEDVTRRAGKSRASYYRTEGFPASDPSNPEARRSVLERAIAEVLLASANDVEQVVGGIATYIENGWVSESPRDFIRTTSEENFDELADHAMVTQLLAGALAPSSSTVESALADFYRRVTDAYSESYAEALRFWGYRPKPPLTVEKFTVVIMALAEGLMLRLCGDETVDRTLFGELLETVGTALLVAEGDIATDAVPPEHDLPGDVPPPGRAQIISGLVRIFDSERAALPTIEELARYVGCSTQTIRTQFGGVVGVIRAAWAEWIPQFEEVAHRNRKLLLQDSPLTVLYRVAITVARRAAEQTALTRALLMSEIGVDPVAGAAETEPISDIFEGLLRDAGASGAFRVPAIRNTQVGTDDVFLFARALRTTILTIVVSHPMPEGFDADSHAQWCVDYVWSMLMPARNSGAPAEGSSES